MINKKTIRLYTKLTILVVSLLIITRIFVLVLSKYESEAESNAELDIAFYLFKEDYKTMTLDLDSLLPKNEAYTYNFSVGNSNGQETAEIDLKYKITIRTTTNLPLTYELYMNQKYNDKDAKNIIINNNVASDEDGTYFKTMETEEITLLYTNATTNNYQLVVYFPENYNSINYQDIIEMVEIRVESEQFIS